MPLSENYWNPKLEEKKENETIILNVKYRGKLTDYDFIKLIGEGGQGQVYQVKCNVDGQMYAIKKILVKDEDDNVWRELEIISQLKSIYIVKFVEAFIEKINIEKVENLINEAKVNENFMKSPSENTFLYIVTELCTCNLQDRIDLLREKYSQINKKFLNPVGYYLASQLFFEIVQAVEYLHKLPSPIIHRDLKPTNILLTDGRHDRFVKIGDFGLATFHSKDSNNHTKYVGTFRFMAPEVKFGWSYDTSADIYSLGFIMLDLFNLDINNELKEHEYPELKSKYKALMKLIKMCTQTRMQKRPNSEKILQNMKKYTLNKIKIVLKSIPEISRESVKKRVKDFSRKEFLQKRLRVIEE